MANQRQEAPSSRKRRRKNKTHSLTRQDELETAKAAARKLLDHASDQQWHSSPHHEIVSNPSSETDGPPNLNQSIQDFNSDSTINRTNTNPEPTHDPIPSASRSITHNPSTEHSASSSSQSVKVDSCFYVTREEVFKDTSIVDAFQAAMAEFNFHRRLQKCSSSQCIESEEPERELQSIKLPQSSIEQRRRSALYYGQPPSHAVIKTKKPRMNSIFLPRLNVSPIPVDKQAQPKREEKQDLGKSSTPRGGGNQKSGSDIDMEEYWDLMGTRPDGDDDDDSDDSNGDNDECQDDDEDNNHENGNDNQEGMQEKAAEKENRKIEGQNEEMLQQNKRSISEPHQSDEPESKGTMTTVNPVQTIQSSRSNVQINGTTRGGPTNSMNVDVLTDSQKNLLSNALNAQYWAGYHTAVFNQSLGINLENLPILVPQINNNNNSSGNNNSITSFSPPNFASLSFSTSQCNPPSH